MAQHFDLIVIGSGPAGRRAAVQAAKLKKSVLVVERGRRVGGVCEHRYLIRDGRYLADKG